MFSAYYGGAANPHYTTQLTMLIATGEEWPGSVILVGIGAYVTAYSNVVLSHTEPHAQKLRESRKNVHRRLIQARDVVARLFMFK